MIGDAKLKFVHFDGRIFSVGFGLTLWKTLLKLCKTDEIKRFWVYLPVENSVFSFFIKIDKKRFLSILPIDKCQTTKSRAVTRQKMSGVSSPCPNTRVTTPSDCKQSLFFCKYLLTIQEKNVTLNMTYKYVVIKMEDLL